MSLEGDQRDPVSRAPAEDTDDHTPDEGSEARNGGVSPLARMHPIGWVASGVIGLGLIFMLIDTDAQIGHLEWWHWLGLLVTIGFSLQPIVLHRIRVAIDSVATVTKTIAWILAWVVFVVSLFNVITRYSNGLVDRDIYYAQAVSVAWQSFGLMFLLGVNYGVRDGVNPRIDFWWANFRPKTKAWLDFALHTMLLIPFIVMGYRILLESYVPGALGRRANGEWPSGHRVWETWEQSTDAGQLPIGPIKAMLVGAFVLFGIQIIAEVIKTGFVIIGDTRYGELTELDAPQRIE